MAALADMGVRFLADLYSGVLVGNRAALAALMAGLMAAPRGCVLVAERDGLVIGGICGVVHEHPMSGDTIASELGWWTNPDARGPGVRLLKAFEAWARTQGACALQMVAPNDHVGAFYRRVGYAQVETLYQRRIA